MKAVRLIVEDQSPKSGIRKFFSRPAPLPYIGGNNFFTGDYNDGVGHMGLSTESQEDWDLFWRQTLKQDPPGPLPDGAKGIMIATQRPEDPVGYEPEKIAIKDKEVSIDWKRIHLAKPGEVPGKSQFAVLIVPALSERSTFRDVFAAEEQRKVAEKLDEDMKVFTEGSRERITILPVTRLKRKPEFSRL